MNLLIVLSVPALSGVACMAAAITMQTLYLRLRDRETARCVVVSICKTRRF